MKARKLLSLSKPLGSGAPHGVRIRGGTQYNSGTGKWHAMLHLWDNPQGDGQPEEALDPKEFDSQDEALEHYKKTLRPVMEKMQEDLPRSFPGALMVLRKILE